MERKETKCWTCQNFAKCSWAKGVPVEGWDATPTTYLDVYEGDRRVVKSYFVNECPQYLQDNVLKTTSKKICDIIGISQRTFLRNIWDKTKKQVIVDKLEAKGYRLIIDQSSYKRPVFYLEKLDESTNK